VEDYAIFMLDVKGNVRTWNAGAVLLKGYKPEEIIGKHFSIFYSEEDIIAEKPRRELGICLREGKIEDESWRYCKDGSRFWASVIITAVYQNGVHTGFSKVVRDLTGRKATEARLISAYDESSKLKSAFLANISHEIRTPMHGMLSALTLLRDSSLTPEQQELAGIVDESGSVLLRLINDVLDYSKLTSGTFSIASVAISVSDIITSVVRSYQATLKPTMTLQVSLDPKLPRSGQGDPTRYRQIVQNLMSNATKFTESGYINLRAWVKSEDGNAYTVRTSVTDTGIGIPDIATKTLFTPFTQFDTSATKRYQGTGLGLSISKSLAEQMGGSIGFHHNPDVHGSVFWFDIKLEKLGNENWTSANSLGSTTQQRLPSSLNLMETVRAIASGKRILLAEDNFINQKVMLMMPKKLGFSHIDTATNGIETARMAVAKQNPPTAHQDPTMDLSPTVLSPVTVRARTPPSALQNSPPALARPSTAQPYDLILMDINMPLLDGIRSTHEIRRAGISTPIIAMTAYTLSRDGDSLELRDTYVAQGINDYIPKPVNKEVLLKALVKWLK
jgi:osomolarity two-component system sensor histidine kinase TcsA